MKLTKPKLSDFLRRVKIILVLLVLPCYMYSQSCSCDQTLTPGSNLNDLVPGTTYCIASGATWSGSINQLQSGSTICVQENAIFLPSGVDANGAYAGDIVNYGIADLSSVQNWPIKTDDMQITNYNELTMNSFQTDRKLILNNLGINSNLVITGAFSFTNGTEITNEGSMTSEANFITSSGTSVDNTGILSSEQDINIGGGFYNNGYVKALGTININTGADVYNDCTFYSEKEFKTSSNTKIVNVGLIYVDDKVNNDSKVTINGEFEHNGIFYAKNYEFQANASNPFYGTDGLIYVTGGNNSTIENSAGDHFYGSDPTLPIVVYDQNYVAPNCGNTDPGYCIFENNQNQIGYVYTNVIRETVDPGEPKVPSFLITDCGGLVFPVATRDTFCVDENPETLTSIREGDDYIWSTGETTRTISVSPLVETVYTVTVTVDNPPSIFVDEYVGIPGTPPTVRNDTISLCNNSTGIIDFDLTTANIVVTPSNYNITYYNTHDDAVNQENSIPTPYTTSGCETVYARVTEDDICYAIAEIYLDVLPLPNGGIVTESITLCPGESILPIEFCGPPNGTITYNDGTTTHIVNLDASGNATSNIAFNSTTTFQIIDVSNSSCTFTY